MKPTFFIAIAFLVASSVRAQQKPAAKFSSINQLGFITGSSDQAIQAQTINGVAYKTWFAGIGAGFDGYGINSIPLFADVRKAIFPKQQTPFIYLDLGTSLPLKKEEKSTWYNRTYSGGLYYEAGVGYAWPVKGRLSVNLSAGFSQKSLRETRTFSGVVIDFPPYERELQKEYYDYTYRRFSFKLALQF